MQKAEIGVFGLGTMGSALALNLADHGFRVAVTNRETSWLGPFVAEAGALADNLTVSERLADFVASLAAPRTIVLMIPAGNPVDAMIAELSPLLSAGDMIVDAGNSDFNDTRRRSLALAGSGLELVGMGVSGGEDGARHGPSMMVGGSLESWRRLGPVLETIAARFDGDPCVAHVGPDGAGHFVKTVHNGIEYADMQMITEIYGLLRDGAGWDAGRIGTMFTAWTTGPLASFLVEITGSVLSAADPKTGKPMVDVILDTAGQKGTGRWTVIEALKLGQSASTIEAAVGARAWSSETETRRAAEGLLPADAPGAAIPNGDDLAGALLAGRILGHAQGFSILAAASAEYDWSLDLVRIAEIWRAGCIIRSALLNDIADALKSELPQDQLILAPAVRAMLSDTIPSLRRVVTAATATGLPAPALSAALGWYDSLRRERGTANLLQAQRDVFGNHGFQRIDEPGNHHGNWPARDKTLNARKTS